MQFCSSSDTDGQHKKDHKKYHQLKLSFTFHIQMFCFLLNIIKNQKKKYFHLSLSDVLLKNLRLISAFSLYRVGARAGAGTSGAA
jgi:hypothetical protein